jgi:hypothetical protein
MRTQDAIYAILACHVVAHMLTLPPVHAAGIVQSGFTALILACSRGHVGTVRLLLTDGHADPDATDFVSLPLS